MNEDGKKYFGIGLETTELENSKEVAMSMFNEISKQAEQSSHSLDESFTKAIENIKKDFEKLDPDFGKNIQLEIDRNVSALEELQGKILEVG